MATLNRNRINNRNLVLALAIGAIAAWIASLQLAGTPSPASVDGLASPRGLTPTSDGSLLIAEGGAGRLLKWELSGEPTVISDGFPFLEISGIEGESASGIAAALEVGDGSYLAIVGEARRKGHQEAYRLTPPNPPEPITGQDVLSVFHPQPITNPYDFVVSEVGDLLVTDSGRNTVLRITPDGDVGDYALLPVVEVPNEPETTQGVPTGAVWGPDGALYVTTLTGWPHPPGAATVYRIADANADGDALDEGEVSQYATGFSAATDLAFEADGSLLVTEFSTDMAGLVSDLTAAHAAELAGRLVRRGLGGSTTVVAENLVGPTGVALVGDRIFVAEEFGGRVVEIGPGLDASLGVTGWLVSAATGVIAALLTLLVLRVLIPSRPPTEKTS